MVFMLTSDYAGHTSIYEDPRLFKSHPEQTERTHHLRPRDLLEIDIAIRFLPAFRAPEPNFLGHLLCSLRFNDPESWGLNESLPDR
jgi:hypothetical protein